MPKTKYSNITVSFQVNGLYVANIPVTCECRKYLRRIEQIGLIRRDLYGSERDH